MGARGRRRPARGFFSEYLKDEAATAEAWAGGWFHTGDIVRADADGDLYFVDRKKNVIRRSGENISAVEVESVLAAASARGARSAVAATPDAVRGDEVLACIVRREPRADDRTLARWRAQHRRSTALAQLAYYKAPGYVAFVDALPLTVVAEDAAWRAQGAGADAARAAGLHRHPRAEEADGTT